MEAKTCGTLPSIADASGEHLGVMKAHTWVGFAGQPMPQKQHGCDGRHALLTKCNRWAPSHPQHREADKM